LPACESNLVLVMLNPTAGIDVGSLSTDVVIAEKRRVLGYAIVPTLAHGGDAAASAFDSALLSAGLSRDAVGAIVSTGYGRGSVEFASRTVTEITCHAVGARVLFPQAAMVIDIGGQDSKVIRLGPDGRVEDFVMNDKCAAGTGRFLEVMAQALDVPLECTGEMALGSSTELTISSTCTVFAESEVVALAASGAAREDVLAAINRSVVDRILGMVSRIHGVPPPVMTGGVAKNSGIVREIESRLGTRALIPDEPQIVGALGAAIIAGEAV